ncbi:MAG: tRNA uridine-5-carboxymethylaminomethyl(34) synthesis GTPase MnmE, partial [Hyphomicrobiales bacterium]|nr:tRNA uridine-5-carboxymethylaminomethyl(34) synthesis GTPase MnmE [Hyphomicrobiales bacterium]
VEPAAESRFDSETLRILNKADLLTEPKDQPAYDLSMSALNQADIEVLVAKLAEMVKKRYHGDEPALITRHRHRVAVQNCLNSVTEALGAIDQPLELVAENIRLAVREIGRIVGRVDVEDLLDVIFQDFCVGK